MSAPVHPASYYSEWYGHSLDLLERVHESLRSTSPDKSVVWLAGDSSLDNKHWLFDDPERKHMDSYTNDRYTAQACNGYEHVLRPTRMVQDVCYHFNRAAADAESPYVCINASIEETTLAQRQEGLLPQDHFILNNMRDGDVLVVSIGGNDIALRPSLRTIASMAGLNWFTRQSTIEQQRTGWGVGHLESLFRDSIQTYIERLCANASPSKVLVCMIYYPCEDTSTPSWADPLLSILGYNRSPEKLKAIIDMAYARFTCNIKLEGVTVVPVALSQILDSTDGADYDNRVEPAVQGGRKMGQAFHQIITSE